MGERVQRVWAGWHELGDKGALGKHEELLGTWPQGISFSPQTHCAVVNFFLII